ncbi:ArsA-related P-loop ATPase [Ornithinicoccus hortensis]|uniref:Arsenite efflux ATP-binding protein ArsA n=1 Tax=Ornithinicoccus hortensis TaxID=82346 RepID=A0A542YW33_9MICO|nr:ArsA-related P-loop ATPase [Ornithinicoccus hortensis]TQL52296.1 arsenite efflux ATP-binding protein ArsA [Ornithinicoccus hortensis]
MVRADDAASWHGGSGRPRLHVVTGKGGTGKTTVAAALALALAGAGQRALLCEVEERQGISQVLDVAPLGDLEQPVTAGLDGGEVIGLSAQAGTALVEYLRLFYKLGRAGDLLRKMGAIDFATTIAPGVRDVLLGGKIYEASRRTRGGRHTRPGAAGSADPHEYDAIVLDAPPTGRVGRFLNVTEHLADLARVGPIRAQADSISELLHSPATAVHLVTLLEQMPVQETADALTELTGTGLHPGAVIVNQVRATEAAAPLALLREDGQPDPEVLTDQLASVGIRPGPATVRGLLQTGREALDRWELEQALHTEVEAMGRPVLSLPHLPEGIGPDAVLRLAWALRDQGVAP